MLCDDDAHGNQPASLSGSKRPWADSPRSTEFEARVLKRQRREVPPSPCYELSDSQADPMSEAQSTGLTLVADAEASATTPFLGVVSRPRYELTVQELQEFRSNMDPTFQTDYGFSSCPPRSGVLKRQRREVPPN
jgi:hypothetical protein